MVSCYLIGATRLFIKCAELLIKHIYNIKGIIYSDHEIYQFAKQNHIYSSISDATATLDRILFDYLFIITNTHIIPSWLLQKARNLAINYHDALLPKHGVTQLFNQDELKYFTYLTQETNNYNLYWQLKPKESMRINLLWLSHSGGTKCSKKL